uniref:Thyroglobulin type-1 domain-containing protein n=1 Tax=Sphaeramia orbicularis TaxID=375764 RepID=A0A673B756_9TELE
MEETPEQPLLRAPSQQTAVNVGAPAQRTGSTRAYKVAGITLLACVLIVGQAAIAYFLLSQRSDIKSLQDQSKNLKEEMTKGQSASMPMRMHTGMAAVHLQMADVEETSTGSPVPHESTMCQLEASGLKPVDVPGFRPVCDERGFYRTMQCWQQQCWCVDAVTGAEIPNTMASGPVQCNRAMFTGGMVQFQPLTDADA